MARNSNRVIYHIDCDAFYASVEETLHPELKTVPMAICGDPESRRGVILSKNQLAGSAGVKTAETIWQARQKCPDLVLAPARHHLYEQFCKNLNAIYEDYTDQVEMLSIDESFLDVTGSLDLFGKTPEQLANTIKNRVNEELDITVSVGVSYNKIFAKMASDLHKPNGTSIITKENYKEVLWPLDAGTLYSVGKVTADKLRSSYILTIGDIANTDAELMTRIFGKAGTQLYNYANGIDDRPVLKINEGEPVHSVGNGRTFRKDLNSKKEIKVAIMSLSDHVATRLRRQKLKCTTVQVTIKDPNFKVVTRQGGVTATWLAADITKKAIELLEKSWKSGSPIRMLTITASNLVTENQLSEQLSFFDSPKDLQKGKKQESLEQTMDEIRNKYGRKSISSAGLLKSELGLDDK